MWSLLLVTLCLPIVMARICPKDTGPVFIVNHEHSDRNNHCFDFCSNNECAGVLLFKGGCVALGNGEVLPPGEGRTVVEKHCVQNVNSVQIVLKEDSRVLLDHTEKIEKAIDEFHCLSLCSMQRKFSCRSLMFYPESGDCLLNSANSDTGHVDTDTEGFKVVYMERRLPGDSPCISSFSMLKRETRVRGDFRRGNPQSWTDCVLSCDGCEKAVFGGGECLLLKEKSNGKIFDTQHHLVIDNICKEVESPTCTKEESLYVARGEYTQEENRDCLKSCLSAKNCRYAFLSPNGCNASSHIEKGQKPVIERVCPGLGPLESGVLFEERNKCPSGTGLKVTGLNLYQCMALCLSHPTSSCDSISYHQQDEVCELLDSSAVLFSSRHPEKCQHFALGIIKQEEREPKSKHEGYTSDFKRKEIRHEDDSRARALAAKKTDGMKVNLEKQEKEVSLDVSTKCGFSSMEITVKSKANFDGDVFLRNAFDNCASTFKKDKAILVLSLNDSSPCRAEKNGGIYQSVVIVKKSNTEDIPIITERDRMYTVTCDYSNHTARVNASRQLQIRDPNYTEMKIGGKPLDMKPVQMDLRAKRAEHGEPVTIGQPVELSFQQETEGYMVSSCTAENKDGRENLTLIHDGCPTKTAKNYIVRGGLKRIEKGFVLPLRAFKFRSGDIVRISCTLTKCTDCTVTTCNQRSRRNLKVDDSVSEQVHAELLVNDVVPVNHDDLCFNKMYFALVTVIWSLLAVVEVMAVIFMFWRRANRRMTKVISF